MAQSEKELEKLLMDTGNGLLSPPSSVTELLALLDRVEAFLARVEQSPSESMKKALSASMKALVADDLLKHSDMDVKVAVASCVSEITRITAPEAPYDDDKMKEVFQLIVSSFERLDDKVSPSYFKRTSILETLAKVRSCVVMLDLECDALIVEMFGHFFRSIRDDHPDNVFSSMETTMTLVLEESEDISLDLLSPILDFLKIKDKEVPPIARQLAEKVTENCANKLKPYLLPAVKSRGGSLDDYSKVVANVCGTGLEAAEPSNGSIAKENLAGENDLVNVSPEKPVEVAVETQDVTPPDEEVGPASVGSLNSVMSNGSLQKEIEDTLPGKDNLNVADLDTRNLVKTDAEPSKSNAENLSSEEPAKLQFKPQRSNKRKGRKANALKSSSESSKPSLKDGKNVVEVPEPQEKDSKEDDSAKTEDPVTETAEPAKNEKNSDVPVSSPKTLENEPADVPSTSPSESLAEDNRSKKMVRGKKKNDLLRESEETGDIDSKKESDAKGTSEGAGLSDAKSQKRSGKKESSALDKEKISTPVAPKKVDNNRSQLDAKSAKESGKKLKVVSSLREDKKGQVKGTPAKDIAKTPSKDFGKKPMSKSAAKSSQDESDAEQGSKTSSKRKRSSSKEVASKTQGYGSELVGSKVKVWWPADKNFYEGVVDSFDPVKMKHKIVYNDGDIEVLKLEKEKWQLIGDDSAANQGHSSDDESPDESPEKPKGKKAKTTLDLGTKSGKTESAAKRGDASSSKSKATPKFGRKQEGGKVDGKSKEESSKSVGKSDEDKVGKSKQLKTENKSSNDTPKFVKKSKDDGADTLKGGNKSKRDTPKGAVKSKGKSPKSGGKSKTNSTGEVKASSSAKDVEEEEDAEVSPEPAKASVKGKSPNTSKSQKSVKKRKRRAS